MNTELEHVYSNQQLYIWALDPNCIQPNEVASYPTNKIRSVRDSTLLAHLPDK